MWWSDIKKEAKEIREWMTSVSARMTDLQVKVDILIQQQEDRVHCIKGGENLEDNLDRLEAAIQISESSFDKVDRYISNLEKYNGMINELKGCVSLARGAVLDRKQADSEQLSHVHQMVYHVETILKDHLKIIDCLHKNIDQFADFMQKCAKKSRKPRISSKKIMKASPSLSGATESTE